ncbi:MAG: uroporphyrinogen-III C-methyltransferase [Gammaproteobacteria bacterium]|jgi:uroporphyrin-3 C-methyltransferase
MSKKNSSSETGKDNKDQDSVDVDTDQPGVIVDETGAAERVDGSKDTESGDPSTGDADAGSPGDTAAEPDSDADSAKSADDESAAESEAGPENADAAVVETDDAAPAGSAVPPPPRKPPKPRRSWFGFFNFLLILGLAGGAYYYWTLEQKRLEGQRATIASLESQLATKVAGSRLDSSLSSVKSEIDGLDRKIGELETEQKGLRESSETLYKLFGRDRADWQLAEVEYLMRIAQHKLILENDFAGAALTLQAASDRIGLTGDPGLLPVRVTISEEIAELKTRERPDLVGMTLTLARLAREARTLEPGFAPRVDERTTDSGLPQVQPPADWRDRLTKFLDSLVEVRHESTPPTEVEASVANVGETLEDDLKLARWAVLDRDARQYSKLIDKSLRLLREYYDLDNAANHDFMTELQSLQKMQLSPEKPDITGSLRQMQRILSQRENEPETGSESAPQASPESAPETTGGGSGDG